MKAIKGNAVVTAAALVVCIVFALILTMYASPMKDVKMDLSLVNREGAATSGFYDQKGWTVYVREGDQVTELEPTGRGSYQGLALGQTIYLTRVMEEELDSPTLQIGTAERMFSVFLDDVLIYTDCPELENQRIGHLRLPMNSIMRNDPIHVSLPMDYRGKTLTIAQSTPEWSETSRIEATPASVVLYCGYAYESGIIAESYSTAIVAAVLFAVGVALAAAFWRTKDWKLLCIAMTAFLSMCFLLVNTSFFEKYFTGYVDAHWYVRCAAAVFLLLFLTLKAGKFRKFMWGVSILCVLSVPVSLAITATVPDSIDFFTNFLQHGLPEYLLFIGLVASVVLGMVCWRKQSRFYRLYAPLTLIVMVVYWTTALIFDANLSNTLPVGLLSGHITQIYYRVFDICMVTALFAAVVEAVQNELRRRTEKQLLEQSREMAQVTYENMRRQHEEVMMLRHDMLGHLQAVKALSGEEKVQSYLDELIGRNERVRPLIRTGNTMLNIILNARLTAAVDAGIKTEILRLNVPEKLMLSDADLCSLIMNMMNNAITAASQSGADEPYIKLDIHVKDRWLAIVCQNTADTRRAPKKRTEEGVPRHGFGLKIMEEIAQRYNGLFDTESGADYYKVNVILPLD